MNGTNGRSVVDMLKTLVSPRGAVFLLLVVLIIINIVLNPSFAEPGQFMRFIQRVAPVAIAAIGQYFVIVSGNFDLSQGALITAQAYLAGTLLANDDGSGTWPVIAIMLLVGAAVGLINGLLTTLLKVPSFIVTLGMMLVLSGTAMWATGGAVDTPHDEFRQLGRGGIRDIPVLDYLPWAVLVLAGWLALAIWLTKRPYGKTLIALGDNATAAEYAGARGWWVTTRAFMISSVSATVAGILIVGYAGVHHTTGVGFEFTAITAVVLGGVVLGGGRGWVVAAAAGAFVLEALFIMLNFSDVPSTMRPTIQGIIIIAAVAYAGVAFRSRRRARPAASATPPPGPDGPPPQTSPAQGKASDPSTHESASHAPSGGVATNSGGN